jgi:hypothetical protein
MKTRDDLLREKAKLEAEIAVLNRKAEEICNQIGHNIQKTYDTAYCESCDRDFGWYCEKSPDKSCHYHTEGGKVVLNTGESVDMPPDHDVTYENDDHCIYCGEPDERK